MPVCDVHLHSRRTVGVGGIAGMGPGDGGPGTSGTGPWTPWRSAGVEGGCPCTPRPPTPAHCPAGDAQGCIRREGASEVALGAPKRLGAVTVGYKCR